MHVLFILLACSCRNVSFKQELDQTINADARGPAAFCCCHGLLLPHCCLRLHVFAFLAVHGFFYEPCHLVPRDIVVDLQSNAPVRAGISAVGRLLCEERPADHRHAGAYALQRRVPPRVRQEQPGGRMRQDLFLRAPAEEEPSLSRLRVELLRQHSLLARDEVRPDDPQERPAAVRQPPRELGELSRRHDRDAAEVDVHDRAGPLGIQPPEAARVLLPEVPADRGRVGTDHVSGEREKRADGVDAREDAAQRAHDVLLQRVERVDDDPLRAARVLGLPAVEVDHELVRVRRADEAGHVSQTDAPHPGHPVEHRVQVPVGQVALICSLSVARSLCP
uniref:Uncharacterized protein n=1 Tax=Zea mays TaxID=4577 RepID=A0A804NXN9_MAIZE